MTRPSRSIPEPAAGNDGVSTIVEYIAISAIVMMVMVLLMFTMNTAFMEQPRDVVSYHSFVDIGNGVSTRIVDLYVISPYFESNPNCSIKTKFALPDLVAMSSYNVEINPAVLDQNGHSVRGTETITVSRGAIQSTSSLAGIGASLGVGGNTSGGRMTVICYNSSAEGCPP